MIADGIQQSQAEQSAKSAAAKSAAQKQHAQEQIDAALNDNGLSAVKFGALDKGALRAQHILSGSYSGSVRDDGTFYQDTYPQVKQGDQMVPLEGAEDKGGQLFRFDDGAKAEGRQVTVEWAARDDGSAGVYVVSVDGGQFHQFNRDSRIDDLGLSISYGADTYDFKAAAARYEVKKAAADTYNDAMRHSSDYAAINNPDAAAYWAYRARAGEAAAGAAQWSGFWKEGGNELKSMAELGYQALKFNAGPVGMIAPDIHLQRSTIRPEERTGATTFSAMVTATSLVDPLAAPELAAVRVGSLANRGRAALAAVDDLATAESGLSLQTRGYGDIKNLVNQGKLDISPDALDLLGQLRKSGSMVEVPKGFRLDTLADMQKGGQVEFAAVRMSDGSRMLVRGDQFEVFLPKGTTRVIAHSHPGESIFAVRPSVVDAQTIGTFGQRSSLVITENGNWVRFNSNREILSSQINVAKGQ